MAGGVTRHRAFSEYYDSYRLFVRAFSLAPLLLPRQFVELLVSSQ